MRTIGKEFKVTKKPTKAEVIALLEEKGIVFDEKANLNELLTLIPKE